MQSRAACSPMVADTCGDVQSAELRRCRIRALRRQPRLPEVRSAGAQVRGVTPVPRGACEGALPARRVARVSTTARVGAGASTPKYPRPPIERTKRGSDEPNPSVGEALRQLQVDGIRPVMLSGDSPRTTRAIAAELGLAEYEGNCTPAEKRARIEAWQAAGERVGMVGDGVNDAPALAQANLSITVAGGTDVAGETSDVVLTHPDLTLVPWFLRLSHRTRRVIRQNLGWAFAYNLLVVPLAALGIISPIVAAAAMATSSLLVVGNSLRLRH